MMQQLARAQPRKQLVSIGCAEHIVDRVLRLALGTPIRGREQMKIVVAEHDDRRVAQRFHATKHRERLRPAIHEVTDEPEPVGARIESQLIEKPRELVIASLDVADRVSGHGERGGSSRALPVGIERALMQQPRHRQRERCDLRVELRAVIGEHLVAALHRADRRLEDRTARIPKALPW